MQELVGKISALDPSVSESMKVVTYFDALILNKVGLDGLLRAAAVLAGAVAGAERHGRAVRFDHTGTRLDADVDHARTPERSFDSGVVWLERVGAPQANDDLIVERLAFAAGLLEHRSSASSGLAVVIDETRSIDERSAMLGSLRVSAASRVRIVASEVGQTTGGHASTVVPTRHGMLQATLELDGSPSTIDRAGLGLWVRADHAPESWESAVMSLRVTTELMRVVDAIDLGALVVLARAYDPGVPHPDVENIAILDPRTAETLRILVEADSVRSASAELGMHHSTVQAKHESLTAHLGYDPRTTPGRLRYYIAEFLRRLHAPTSPSSD